LWVWDAYTSFCENYASEGCCAVIVSTDISEEMIKLAKDRFEDPKMITL
jgi:ubiquinone/menaquinone biosynthesis C-methylase UbiE